MEKLFAGKIFFVGFFPTELKSGIHSRLAPSTCNFLWWKCGLRNNGGSTWLRKSLYRWLWYKSSTLEYCLFNDGKACGGCYQIVCDATEVPQW